MPGVLEALSGAVAARLAAQETTNGNVVFTFNAGKNSVQGKEKRKGGKGKNVGVFERAENARKVTIGKKRRIPSDPRPTGSELDFSFEKEMESYERTLYGDLNVSSK